MASRIAPKSMPPSGRASGPGSKISVEPAWWKLRELSRSRMAVLS